VTHLPQVAAFADHHFVVSKDDNGTVTSSSVSEVQESDGVDELARMLAGQEESAAAQAHARELLALARDGA
jgi:DNA repair protein RecN (Recombination protein N)